MEHTIDDLKEWLDLTLELLIDEWESKVYKNLSDCPSFRECNVYIETINYLVEANYMPEYVKEFKLVPIHELIKRK